jgi:intracellular septation protein A
LVQYSKRFTVMLVMLFGKVTLVRPLQSAKTRSSILVTLFGMVMLARLVQP